MTHLRVQYSELLNSDPCLQRAFQAHTSHILAGSRGYQRSTSLWITSVNQSDAGTYRCHAHNERGATADTLHLDVRGECVCVCVFESRKDRTSMMEFVNHCN